MLRDRAVRPSLQPHRCSHTGENHADRILLRISVQQALPPEVRRPLLHSPEIRKNGQAVFRGFPRRDS